MSFTLTPNMNIPLPNPAGTSNPEPGPQYAADQNQGFTIIDGHDHSPGSGVQITPAGLNINTNLTFQNNQATNVYGILFSSPASSAQNTFLYTDAQAGGGVYDLFYNDGAGNVIPITVAGAVNATVGNLPGESYAGGTFTWKQGAGSTTPANFDIGSITIRPNTAATTNGVVVGPPSGIASQYNVQLPTVPGSATGIMQINTSGDMLSTLVPDNSSIVITSQNLTVGPLGVQTSMIAAGAVTLAKMAANSVGTTQLVDASVTRAKLAAVGQQISLSSGVSTTTSGTFTTLTNMTVTITTTGRPVIIALQPDGTANEAISRVAAGSVGFYRMMVNGVTLVGQWRQDSFSATIASRIPIAFWIMDLNNLGVAGARTYIFQANNNAAAATGIEFCKLVAYELA